MELEVNPFVLASLLEGRANYARAPMRLAEGAAVTVTCASQQVACVVCADSEGYDLGGLYPTLVRADTERR